MNDDYKQFEKIVAGLNIDDQPNAEHKQTLRKQMLAACKQTSSDNTAIRVQPIWSRIMKSKVTKSATAAIIILGAFIFLTQGNGTSVAWAQVVEQLNNYEKYKCRQRVVREKGPQIPTMDVYHMNLSLRRQEVEDGSIHIIDMRRTDAVTLELYPDKKKAFVTKLLGFGPKKDPDIIDMVKRFEQESSERLGTKKKDGKVLHGFRHQPNEHNDFTVWVDSGTKLPVEIGLKHFRDGQLTQTIFMDEFEFDFELPMSAFSTEVPEGYAVETLINDYRPVEPEVISPEDIQKELNHAAYAIETLPWIKQIQTIKNIDPLGSKTSVYMTGIKTNDKNIIVIVQGNYYDTARMVWLPKQKLTLETPDGIKLYAHPNGSIYAKYFLESFTKAAPKFAYQTLSEERFTRMVVMPDKTVLGLSANNKVSNEQLQELVETLVKTDSTLEQAAEKDTPKPTDKSTATAGSEEKTGRLVQITVTDKETGKPIKMASVYTFGGRDISGTDENGYCEHRWDKAKDSILPIWVRKDGYVRMSYSVRAENSPGNSPIKIDYELEKGTTVGGIIQNSSGDNLSGVGLTLRVNDDEHMDKPENHVRQSVRTDESGRWEFGGVPAQLDRVNLRAKHADYSDQNTWLETAEDIQLLRDKEYVLVVDEGYSITGTVKDEAGNPIKGARAQLGDYIFKDRQHQTHTDETGHFDFKYLRIGNSGPHYEFVEGKGTVNVRRHFEYFAVTAEGFAPQTMTIYFKEKHVELEFVMVSGNPIYGQVVDPEGKPVPKATVRADNWGPRPYDHIRTIDWNTKTDDEGRFVWQHAPANEIQLLINKNGYMELKTEKVKPSDTEYEFVLNSKLRVVGQVIDAVTKEPVTEFTFRRHEGGYISTPKMIKDSEGRFETAFDDQGEKFTISLKAEGYKPTRSREISLIEQDVELIIEMQPDAGIDGVVVDAGGKPLEGVRVVIPNNWLTVNNLKFQSNWLRNCPNVLTDKQGRFHLDPVANKQYSILVLEETGYLYISSTAFPADGRFVLQQYGRIEGTYYKGSQPVVNERIRIDYPRYQYINKDNGITEFGAAFNFNTQTDEQGRFVFDKLIHGTARILIDPYKHVEVKAGKTHEVHLGGDGLTVQGHLLNPDGQPLNEDLGDCFLIIQKIYDSLPIPEEEWPLPENADAMTYSELMNWFTQFGDSGEGRKWLEQMQQKYGELTGHHSFDVDHKGRFEVPNVSPGMYLFTVKVRPWKDPDQHPRMTDHSRMMAQASTVFIVPEYETVEEMDIPVDLGMLKCRTAPLTAGQKAPDFEINNLKSPGKIRLSDYRGKTVLVNFTNPALKEAEPDKAAALEQVCEQAKGKATIINVAMEMLPWEYMRNKMIPECTLPGLYGTAIAHNSKIYADYKTAQPSQTIALPYSVLIDSAGTILWIGTPNEELSVILTEN